MSIENIRRPAAFIDRDGTLIEEVNFLSRVEDLSVFPFTSQAIGLLKQSGYRVIVLTNQSGIGRAIYGEAEMNAIHDAMQVELDNAIDAFYFCPHLPCDGCACRKPGLGMIRNAERDFAIDLENSWMIGDKRIDVETGHNAGFRSAMVLTGYGAKQRTELVREPDILGNDLLDAVRQIVSVRQAVGGP